MENVPPPLSVMSVGNEADIVPTLDQLTRNKPSRKSKKSSTRILWPKPNDHTPGQETRLMDPTSTLISPPPEETLGGQGRTPTYTNADIPPSTSKRKRQSPSPRASSSLLPNHNQDFTQDKTGSTGATQVTPNPKPRKQSRRGVTSEPPESPTRATLAPSIHVSPPSGSPRRRSTSPSKRALLLSPHNANPNADFIPPLPSHSRHLLGAQSRRSITPIPPYEPPNERFTPPREVIGTPIGGGANKRKQSVKRPGKLKLVIKEEPPDIDFSVPLPPASPTEDPLLLAGPPEKSGCKPTLKVASPLRPSSSPWDECGVPTTVNFVGTSDTSVDDLPRPDDIVFPIGGWSDSDDDAGEFNQSGEFTGKFTTIKVPTKADPPTSVTKDRQDAWGRPVSPFPYPNRRKSRWSSPIEPALPSHTSQTEHDLPEPDDSIHSMPVDDLRRSPSPRGLLGDIPRPSTTSTFDAVHSGTTEVVSTRARETSQATSQPRLIPSPVRPMFNFGNLAPRPSELDVSPGVPEAHNHSPVEIDDTMDYFRDSPNVVAELTQKISPVFSRERSVQEEEEEEEDFVDRELSVDLYNDEPAYQKSLKLSESQTFDHRNLNLSTPSSDLPLATHDESEESDGEEQLDLGVIKISSEDPMAAARAAAILKLHNYDCLAKSALRRRRSQSTIDSIIRDARRRSTSASGVSKGTPRRRTTGGVIGDKVFLPGSPAMTLPELLKEAEGDLEKSVSASGSTRFMTPVKSYTPPPAAPPFAPEMSPNVERSVIEPREWSKNDWKLLDACFSDERLHVAEVLGLPEDALADVDEVKITDVVDRFVRMVGGDSILEKLGSSWTRQNILKRTRGLEKKQRAGNGAPSRGLTPLSDTSTQIEVPDFTPLGRRQSTIQYGDGSKLPATLLAPRYSHLMDEAVSISKGKEREQRSESPGIFKRLTSPLFSYLPTLTQARPEQPKAPGQHGLPLPPPETFERDRDPIVTPVPKPAPRPTHPKELVHLQPAPVPKPSMIPRVKIKPQRLVELRPAPPPGTPPVRHTLSDRRSSGGSVKDLVKGFEKLDESTDSAQLSRSTRSINEWRTDAPGANSKSDKPKWKP